jgi:hypothetical protein
VGLVAQAMIVATEKIAKLIPKLPVPAGKCVTRPPTVKVN